MTKIERLQNIGIRRLGTPKRGFRYKPVNGRLTKADLDRISNLKIPPAWTDVFINPAASGSVQVIGKDTAGRWQYLYHENHTRTQELRKFRRITRLAKAIPAMRAAVARHLRQKRKLRETNVSSPRSKKLPRCSATRRQFVAAHTCVQRSSARSRRAR